MGCGRVRAAAYDGLHKRFEVGVVRRGSTTSPEIGTKAGARAEGGTKAVKEGNLHENTYNKGFGRVVAVLRILVALSGLLTPGDVGPLGLAGMLLGALGFSLVPTG